MSKPKSKAFRLKPKGPAKDKTVKVEPICQVMGDRVSWNISYEPFNGCWIGFGYESDVHKDETLEECCERVFEFAKSELTKKAEEFSSQNQEG